MKVAIYGVVGAGLLGATLLNAETLLLSNAVVHPVSSASITNGEVLVQNGRIIQIFDSGLRSGRILPTDVTELDLKGQHLYPGMIALNTDLGLVEIDAIRATRDNREVGDYTPEVESWVAVNPDSELLPVARANGVSHFEPVPLGSIVSGQSGLVALDGWTTEQMTIKKPMALHIFWPEMTLDTTPKEKARDKSKWKSLGDQARERAEKIKALDDFSAEARAFAKARDAAKNGAPDPGRNLSWEAMLAVVRGEVPITIHAPEVRQITAAVRWAETNGFKIRIASGQDAWMVAGLLAEKNIPVIYDTVFSVPGRDTESYDVHFSAPEILRKAGVKVVFATGTASESLVKNLPYHAAQAVAYGYPADEALKGITLYPAQLAGVADRLGSIEAGKEATLFAADGDILDIRSNVKRMWIAGKEVSLESRHTRLYEKYKNRPRTK